MSIISLFGQCPLYLIQPKPTCRTLTNLLCVLIVNGTLVDYVFLTCFTYYARRVLCFSVLLHSRHYRSQHDVATVEIIPIEHGEPGFDCYHSNS